MVPLCGAWLVRALTVVQWLLAGLQEHREKRLEGMLDSFKALCAELGEDDVAAAADVHPSLTYLW